MITLEFKDFNEMVAFAQQLLKGQALAEEKTTSAPVTVPDPLPAPVHTAAPVQQMPAAPIQQPVPPAAPTAPIQQPVPSAVPTAPVQQPVPPVVPTTAPSYTLDDLARAAMTLMDAGRQAELQQLLTRFGVEALPSIPQAQYGAFATALRGMGAQI